MGSRGQTPCLVGNKEPRPCESSIYMKDKFPEGRHKPCEDVGEHIFNHSLNDDKLTPSAEDLNCLKSLRRTLTRKPEMKDYFVDFVKKTFHSGHAKTAPMLKDGGSTGIYQALESTMSTSGPWFASGLSQVRSWLTFSRCSTASWSGRIIMITFASCGFKLQLWPSMDCRGLLLKERSSTGLKQASTWYGTSTTKSG